jgi:hypothetical protein
MSTLSLKNVKIQDSTGTLVSTLSYDGTSVAIDKPVSAPTAAAGTNNTQLATTGFVVGEKGGRRNYLINGNFDKWDYATSQTSSGYGSDNRWYNYNNGSTKTNLQVACGDTERSLFNAMYFSRTVVSSVAGADSYVHKWQAIENINLLAGKTITLSFWARADANKNIAVEFEQNFGTGGSPSAVVSGISSQLVPLTTSWQKKTITVTLPSTVGKTLGTDGVQTTLNRLLFWFDAGSNFNSRTANLGQQSGTFDIAQVKIEDGSVATNGWHPYDGEFGSEIQACERYYEISDKSNTIAFEVTDVPNRGGGMWYFRTPKRIVPTISFNGATSDYAIWIANNSTNVPITSIIGYGTGLSRTRILAFTSSGISQGQATFFSSVNNNGYAIASAEL